MVECIGLVEQFLKGTDKVAFMGNVEKQAAVVRMITILDEASKPVPNEIRERYPDLPWKRMASMRDILVHGYFKVNLDLVWTVATEELGPLKRRLTEILEEIGNDRE
jgi:uncharacterized protein with HEPN domain